MEHAIRTLAKERKAIERNIRKNDLMKSDMKKARKELSKINELKKAIKILKQKISKS